MLGSDGKLIPYESHSLNDFETIVANELARLGSDVVFLSHRWLHDDPDPDEQVVKYIKDHPNQL